MHSSSLTCQSSSSSWAPSPPFGAASWSSADPFPSSLSSSGLACASSAWAMRLPPALAAPPCVAAVAAPPPLPLPPFFLSLLFFLPLPPPPCDRRPEGRSASCGNHITGKGVRRPSEQGKACLAGQGDMALPLCPCYPPMPRRPSRSVPLVLGPVLVDAAPSSAEPRLAFSPDRQSRPPMPT